MTHAITVNEGSTSSGSGSVNGLSNVLALAAGEQGRDQSERRPEPVSGVAAEHGLPRGTRVHGRSWRGSKGTGQDITLRVLHLG